MILLFTLGWGAILTLLLILAISGVGSYHVQNSYLSAHEFLAHFGPRLFLLDVAMLSTAFGVATRARWLRPATVLWLLGFGLWPYVSPTSAWTPAPGILPMLVTLCVPAAAAWYLYFTDGSRAHFEGK